MNRFTVIFLTLLLWSPLVFAWQKMTPEQVERSLLYSTAQEIDVFKKDNSRYPNTLDELKTNHHVNLDLKKRLPFYHLNTDGKSFELVFLGSDGKYGTSDDIKYDPSKMADNMLPMYGGLDHVKTPYQLESDEKFIQIATQGGVSREKVSQKVAENGWEFFNTGDLSTAMKRFNQAWLLDPDNSEVYKGFAAILRKQGKVKDAEKMERMIKK